MTDTTNQNQVKDIVSLACEKINDEFKTFAGDNKARAVSSYVSNVIQDFCKQDPRFAEVVFQFKQTLSDCCADIMKGVGASVSDIDVYRNAVKFYFPNSEVSMTMTIDITGSAPDESEIQKEADKPKPKKIQKPTASTEPDSDDEDDSDNSAPAIAPDSILSKKAAASKKKPEDIIQLSLF